MRRLWAIGVLLTGCVSPLAGLRASRELTVGSAAFVLRSAETSTADQERVATSLARAVPPLDRWGGLAQPVTISLLASHDDLESVVRRRGFGWLRAWARYDDVLLQAPQTWLPADRDDELDELLSHELTHCLLFQRAATKETWLARQIPLWFREGMATNTAQQARRFPNLEDLARWLEEDPARDVFADGEALSRDFYEPVYGISHHAVAFLLRRYGDGAVTATIGHLAKGSTFPEAFAAATGLGLASFQRDFVNYLRFRGFRSPGRSVKKRPWRELIEELRPAR